MDTKINIPATIAPWPKLAQTQFLACRDIIQTVAARAEIGPIVETLKWGQPSWLPQKPRTGSTLRIMWDENDPDYLSLFVNCKTTLGETMQSLYPATFRYTGNRALAFRLDAALPRDAIDHCAFLTLTYHRKPA